MSPQQGMEQLDQPSAEALRERMLAGFPIVERRISLAGVSTAVLEGGHGPPIVLLCHDLQVPVRIAEAASARYGWPLHVIDDVGDDPAMQRPEAFIEALRAGLTPLTRAEAGS